MRAVIQRVTRAEVRVDYEVVGRIAHGYVVLLGVGPEDTESSATRLATKLSKLRVFGDDDGKMNLSVLDVAGSVLVVSQFTLFADTRQGNRPGFSGAAAPALAESLYTFFCRKLEHLGIPVETGRFGADMEVDLVNDGPVTLWLEEPMGAG